MDQHSQSVSILFIYANIFSTLDFFTVVTAGQKKIYCQIQSNNSEKMKSLGLPAAGKKMIFYLIFCIKYPISTPSTQWITFYSKEC